MLILFCTVFLLSLGNETFKPIGNSKFGNILYGVYDKQPIEIESKITSDNFIFKCINSYKCLVCQVTQQILTVETFLVHQHLFLILVVSNYMFQLQWISEVTQFIKISIRLMDLLIKVIIMQDGIQ